MGMSKKNCLSFLAVILVFSLVAPAQQKRTDIWDKQIMKQPFDKESFCQVKIPEWLQDTVGCGYTLSGMDFANRKKAAEAGVTISEMIFVDPFYAYYYSDLLAKRSPHVPPDKLERDIAEYKQLGVRILGVYPPCLQGEVYEKHPEWRRIATNTTDIPQIDMVKYPHGGMLCLLGPYGDFFIDVLVEIVTKFPDVDAFSFDGLHYGSVCYCQNCRENFRKDTGKEIPNADLNNPEFRRYQHWADRKMENCIQRMQTRLKAIKPGIALVTWTTNAGRWGHFLSIPRNMPTRMNLLLDAPDQEFWLDESNRGMTVVPAIANAYIWATTNHRVAFSEPYIMTHGNPYGKDSFPPQEIYRRMMLAATYGACPSIAAGQPENLQKGLYDCLNELKKRKEWLTRKEPEPWAALVLSDNTRVLYGRSAGKVEERYMSNILGAFRTAIEEHLQVNIINDWNLNTDDLSKYKVLILPNTACLSDGQVESIKQFVKNGGGLVASVDTSLFNEFGDPRDNFALADVFGVTYKGMPESKPGDATEDIDINFAEGISDDYWEKRKGIFGFKQDTGSFLNKGYMPTYVGSQDTTFKGQAIQVALESENAKTVATIQARGVTGAPVIPAVVTNICGKGRVVYLAAGLDSAYYLYPYPYYRLVIKNVINWVAREKQKISVEAPMCVHATFMRQKKTNSDRLIVHLFNDINTSSNHALPNDDVPLREETLPIYDIKLTFSDYYKIKNIHLEPERKILPINKTGNGIEVVLPRLEIHSMVVAELK